MNAAAVFIMLSLSILLVSFHPFFDKNFIPRSKAMEVIASAENHSGVLFLGHIYNVDLDQKSIQISWLIIGCGTGYYDTSNPTGTSCGRLVKAIDIYIDGSPIANFSYSYDQQPQHTGTEQFGLAYMQTFNEFQTTQTLQIDGPGMKPLESVYIDAQFRFPFDSYALQTVFMALEPTTNNPVPILRLTPVDSAQNFVPVFNDFNTTQRLFNQSTNVPSRSVELTLTRAGQVKAIAILMVVFNWFLTLTVVFVTVVAYWRTDRMSDGLLLLPLTVIFTLPSLRALTGSPDQRLLLGGYLSAHSDLTILKTVLFNCPDLIGIFPQMVTVSISAIFLTMFVIFKQARNPRENGHA